LVFATSAYYGVDLLFDGGGWWGMATRYWLIGSVLLGPPLGSIGALIRRRGPAGTIAALLVPADRQALLNFVASSRWRFEYAEGDMIRPLPRAESVLSRPLDAESASLRVWPTPDLLAIFRFSASSQIDVDIDLRKIQDQATLDAFCAFLKRIGRRLGKPVLMDAEGGDPRFRFPRRDRSGRLGGTSYQPSSDDDGKTKARTFRRK